MKKNILITGGTGQIGSWLSMNFLKLNYNIFSLQRNLDGLKNNKVFYINCDIRDEIKLKKKLSKFNFDFCIHASSLNDKYSVQSFETNVVGTKNLLKSLISNPVPIKLINLSTFQVYGKSYGKVTEKTPTSCYDDYTTHKLCSENLITNWSNNTKNSSINLRVSNTYGFNEKLGNMNPKNFIFKSCLSACTQNQINLSSLNEEFRDYIHLDDLFKIIKKLIILKNFAPLYNVGSGYSYSNLDIAYLIREIIFKKYNKIININFNFLNSKRKKKLIYDCERIYKAINLKALNKINFTVSKTLRYVFDNYTNL